MLNKYDPYFWAIKEYGQTEIPGPQANPRITWYHSFTDGKATSDEISWCSSFVNAAVFESGLVGTKSAAARSWLSWGQKANGDIGDICVLWRGSKEGWQGHVGFVHVPFRDGASVVCLLGGNQANAVSVQYYPAARILDFRKPL